MKKLDIDYSKLITDNNQFLTQGMFWEFRHSTRSTYYPFNLKERDYKTSISMYQIYMSCDSEYEAAMLLLNSWKHWEVLCNAPWFMKELVKWREEREIREAAIGKKVLIEEAENGNVAAARYLVDINTKRKAGRTTKDEVEGQKRKEAAINNKVSSLIERMKVKE